MTKPRAAPADARETWESFEKVGQTPTLRGVADAMNASGKFSEPVNHKQVQRWKQRGWADVKSGTERRAKAVEAEAKLEAALPALTGEPAKRLADLAGKPSAPKKGEGEAAPSTEGQGSPEQPPKLRKPEEVAEASYKRTADMTLAELREEAQKIGLRGLIAVWEMFEERPDLVVERPESMGNLIGALSGSMVQQAGAAVALHELKTNEMKTIEHNAGGKVIDAKPADPFADVMAAVKRVNEAA